MKLSKAVRTTRAMCQAKCLHTAQQRLQSLQADLKPRAAKERDWPQLASKDVLQLRLTSAAAENGIWHEYVIGRHKYYQADLKSKRRMARHRLLQTKRQLLSWSALAEFWDYVDYDGPVPSMNPDLGCCWLWRGNKHPGGYGVFRVPKYGIHGQTLKHGGKKRPVYVIMFILDRGRFPRPICRHVCASANSACINPRHLTTGTAKNNAKDRQQAGQTRGYPNATIHSLNQLEAPVTEY